ASFCITRVTAVMTSSRTVANCAFRSRKGNWNFGLGARVTSSVATDSILLLFKYRARHQRLYYSQIASAWEMLPLHLGVPVVPAFCHTPQFRRDLLHISD